MAKSLFEVLGQASKDAEAERVRGLEAERQREAERQAAKLRADAAASLFVDAFKRYETLLKGSVIERGEEYLNLKPQQQPAIHIRSIAWFFFDDPFQDPTWKEERVIVVGASDNNLRVHFAGGRLQLRGHSAPRKVRDSDFFVFGFAPVSDVTAEAARDTVEEMMRSHLLKEVWRRYASS